jgi:hypothetical protein
VRTPNPTSFVACFCLFISNFCSLETFHRWWTSYVFRYYRTCLNLLSSSVFHSFSSSSIFVFPLLFLQPPHDPFKLWTVRYFCEPSACVG